MFCVNGFAASSKGQGGSAGCFCVNRRIGNRDAARDSFPFREKHDTLVGIFHSIGGEGSGVAPFIPAKTMARFDGHLPNGDWRMLIGETNRRVHDFARHNRLPGLGASAAIVSVQDGVAQACNLGDCRIYLYDGGGLKKLSREHTGTDETGRTVLTRFLGMPEKEPEPHLVTGISLEEGAILLLCSASLTRAVSEDTIRQAMEARDCKKMVESLMAQAAHCAVQESITIAAIACEEKESWLSRFFR